MDIWKRHAQAHTDETLCDCGHERKHHKVNSRGQRVCCCPYLPTGWLVLSLQGIHRHGGATANPSRRPRQVDGAMILRVRFRPAEEWPACHNELTKTVAGLWIEIDSAKQFAVPCGGRAWFLTPESGEMIQRVSGIAAPPGVWWF